MKGKIKLGYEVETGDEVSIEPSHLIVTGLTQKAGKTTTLESLISRSKRRAIVFRTKIGEKSFLNGTIIPPYFKDRSDWQFVQGLVEATIKEKLRTFERAKIIQICKQSGNSLLDFKKKVDERLSEPKLNNFEKDILTNIQAYLEIVLPKLQSINFSNKLELVEGLNIIDLERFSRDGEVQSLIIRSVLEEVLYNFKDVIIVIPEAWKFIPQDRGNPCKLIVEEFIRQGATNGNYIWIDSQDMSGVDKTPLKQITEWILGYQSEKNEVKHTLEQIPLPKAQKPKENDIMSLGTGIFYLATREKTIKTYIQPFWLDDGRAKKVAKGEIKLSELDAPENLTPFKVAIKQPESITDKPSIDFAETTKRFNKELSEMSTDFFNKIADIQEQINKLWTEIFNIKNQPKQDIDEDTLIRKVLQKIPINNVSNQTSYSHSDKEALIREVIARIPKSVGSATYEVAPLEKIKKDFLNEAKEKIIADIGTLNSNAKKILKYLESRGVGCSVNEIAMKCLLYPNGAGGYSKIVNDGIKDLANILVGYKHNNGKSHGRLKERIKELLGVHEATEQEIDNIYSHILMEMLK